MNTHLYAQTVSTDGHVHADVIRALQGATFKAGLPAEAQRSAADRRSDLTGFGGVFDLMLGLAGF